MTDFDKWYAKHGWQKNNKIIWQASWLGCRASGMKQEDVIAMFDAIIDAIKEEYQK